MNDSRDENSFLEDLLTQKEELLPTLIRSFQETHDNLTLLENVQLVTQFLILYNVNNIEDELLVHLMPTILKLIQNICIENNSLAIIDEASIEESLKTNLQKINTLVEVSKEIVLYLTKFNSVQHLQIPTLPTCLGDILLTTFEHCRQSQTIYHTRFKSLNEIPKLFHEARELHSKFLHFLDNCIVFDFIIKRETLSLIELLTLLCKISEKLSGMNAKSMLDNWKCVINLTQKYATELNNEDQFNVSFAIRILSSDILTNITAIVQTELTDEKKRGQNIQITRFLVTVSIKLLESFPRSLHLIFDDLLIFFSALHTIPSSYYRNQLSENTANLMTEALFDNSAEFIRKNTSKENFLKLLSEVDIKKVGNKAGLLVFLSKTLQSAAIPSNFACSTLVFLVFKLTTHCYVDFITKFDSIFYGDLITNIAVIALSEPNNYSEVEKILLEFVVSDSIWAALIATDSWCLIIQNSLPHTNRLTVKLLIQKIRQLNLSNLVETPQLIQLRILTQRLFVILPNNGLNDEIVCNPSEDLPTWKILSLKSINLSQRFQVEHILNDLYRKMVVVENGAVNCDDVTSMLELCGLVSGANLRDLNLNLMRFAPLCLRYWSFNATEMAKNAFLPLFVYYLMKMSLAMSEVLTGEAFLIILRQLRQLCAGCDSLLYKLFVCDLFRTISRRNSLNFPQKCELLTQICDTLGKFITDNNPIVVEMTLEILSEFSANEIYKEPIVNRLVNKNLIVAKLFSIFKQRSNIFHFNYMESIKSETLRHKCLEWTVERDVQRAEYEPEPKRVKYDQHRSLDQVDELILNMKCDADKLTKASKSGLNSAQIKELNKVLAKIELVIGKI